jgi:hypothetical protein
MPLIILAYVSMPLKLQPSLECGSVHAKRFNNMALNIVDEALTRNSFNDLARKRKAIVGIGHHITL